MVRLEGVHKRFGDNVVLSGIDLSVATGEVLVDQLVQMQRTGFSSAVLSAGQDVVDAQRQFERYSAFYQGDAVNAHPRFKEAA